MRYRLTVAVTFFCFTSILFISETAFSSCGFGLKPEFASRKIISVTPAHCICKNGDYDPVQSTDVKAKTECYVEVEIWRSSNKSTNRQKAIEKFASGDKRLCATKPGTEAKNDLVFEGVSCRDTGPRMPAYNEEIAKKVPRCSGKKPNPNTCFGDISDKQLTAAWIKLAE